MIHAIHSERKLWFISKYTSHIQSSIIFSFMCPFPGIFPADDADNVKSLIGKKIYGTRIGL